jgi:addiction module HigA family antidote
MTIKRANLDSGKNVFADITTGRQMPPVHPGEILRVDFLEPLDMSVYALAKALKMTRSRLNDIARGRRDISADTALRLGRYFGTTAQFWINLQSHFDLQVAQQDLKQIEAEVAPRGA